MAAKECGESMRSSLAGHKPVLAIELGSTKVACALGQPTDGGMAFLGCGLVTLPAGATLWSAEPGLVTRWLEEALDEITARCPLERAIVALTHPELSHHTITAHVDLADEPVTIQQRHLKRLATQAIAQGLPIDRDVLLLEAQGYTGNGFQQVQDPHGLLATRLLATFQLVAVPLAVRRAAIQALESVGIETEQLVYGLKATAAACLQDDATSPPTLLIDVGARCLDAGMIEHGCVRQSLTIPWGIDRVAEEIATQCRMTMDAARRASWQGRSSNQPQVRQLVEQQLDALHGPLDSLVSAHARPDLVVVTGRGALLDGFVEWLQDTLGIPVHLGRGHRLHQMGDLARQVGLTTVVGLLEIASHTSWDRHLQRQTFQSTSARSSNLVDRVLEHTKRMLVEYF